MYSSFLYNKVLMNPDTHFNLPPPVSEAQPIAPNDTGEAVQSAEQFTAPSPEAARRQAPPVLSAAQPQDDPRAALQALDAPAQQMASSTQVPAAADDSVTLDKAMVLKAKQIVAQTADNPFEQNRQLAHIKADYLEKRYGKVIKVAE